LFFLNSILFIHPCVATFSERLAIASAMALVINALFLCPLVSRFVTGAILSALIAFKCTGSYRKRQLKASRTIKTSRFMVIPSDVSL